MLRNVTVVVLVLSLAWIPWVPAFASAGGVRSLSAFENASARKELAPIPEIAPPQTLNLVAAQDAAFAIAERYKPSRYFVDDLLNDIDYDPASAFEFIRDVIRFEPYEGVLRGTEGVLGGQGGNALERALLLKRLLEEMGFDARLVYGTLSDAEAERLIEGALDVGAPDVDLRPLANLAGFVPGMMARLASRAERDYQWLFEAVESDLALARPVVLPPQEVKQHVWVQAKLDGGWTDMDTAFKHAEIGDRFAEVERYSKEAAEQDHQKVSVRVVAEQRLGDQLQEVALLDHEFLAADAAESRIYVTFIPRGAGMGSALAKAMRAQPEFVPVLTITGENIVGRALPGITSQDSVSENFLLGGGNGPELTALHLEVVTRTPSGQRTVSQRTLLDRIPPSSRVAGRGTDAPLAEIGSTDGVPDVLLGVHQLVFSTGSLNPHRVANNLGLAAYFAGTYMSDLATLKALEFDALMWPIAVSRALAVAVNESLAVSAVNDLDGVRFMIGKPRVYIFSLQVIRDGDRSGIEFTVDLLRDDLQAFGNSDVEPEEIAKRNLWYGVFQSAFEASLLEIPYISGMQAADEIKGASVSSVGTAHRVTDSERGALPADVPFALLDQIARGKTVIFSEMQSRQGLASWWSIDAQGNARAMLAPTLGGSSHGWWQSYVDWKPRPAQPRTIHIPIHPDMSNKELEAYLKGNKRAYDEGGGRSAMKKLNKAGKLPKTTPRVVGNEYTAILEISRLGTELAINYWGVVIMAKSTGAFLVLTTLVQF